MTNNVTPIGSQPGAFLAGYSTREQLARKVNRTPETIKKWEKRGLPVVKQGNLRLYNEKLARRWILGELPPPEPRPVGRPPKRAG